jgi:hypothetical protein
VHKGTSHHNPCAFPFNLISFQSGNLEGPMAFTLFFSITVISTISFAATKKTLNLLEIMFIWMTVIIIDHNFLTVTAVDLGMIDFSGHPANYWCLALIRIFLFPLLIVWYFDKTFSTKPYRKWVWLPLGILTLIGVEYLADVLNVFKHTRWHLWWSFIEWFLIFLIVNYSWVGYRNLLRKDAG